jgi:hypothetical protein
MNESFVSSLLSLYESSEVLSTSTSELEIIIFYACYLLMLLRQKRPAEIVIQVRQLLQEVEASVVDAPIKNKLVSELQGLMHLSLHEKSNQCRDRLECILEELQDWIKAKSRLDTT